MVPYFHIFAKRRCKYCTKAVKLLESKKIEYAVTYLDKAPDALQSLKATCEWKTVPIIFEVIGAKQGFIGGFTDLERYLNGEKEEKGRGEGTDLPESNSV